MTLTTLLLPCCHCRRQTVKNLKKNNNQTNWEYTRVIEECAREVSGEGGDSMGGGARLSQKEDDDCDDAAVVICPWLPDDCK
jgi:hypothetical protein